MSTQRPSSKAAAKRRAATRKQTRETLRQALAIMFVIIFICGSVATFTTVPIFQPGATGTAQPAAGATPGQTAVSDVVKELETAGDQDAAANNWTNALSRYQAALALNQGNATLQFKVGKAYINTGLYPQGVAALQQAISLNPTASFVTEAQALIDANKNKTPSATGTASTGVTTTLPITATTTITP